MKARPPLPARPRILVIALRRLGDVLLTTPLLRSLRRGWPQARIDVLVFRDTAAILAGNPDIDGTIECAERPTAGESLALARRLWRGYDLAITTQAGDRPSFFAILAGRTRVGVTERRAIGRIKRFFLHRHVAMRTDLHRVEETLLLADLIGIARHAQIVMPQGAHAAALPQQPYAVLHAAPFFRYKQWHGDGWRALARHLSARGLAVVATGGPGAGERAFLDELWNGLAVIRCDGRLDWPGLAALLRPAQLYVGPDTSVTHLAAAAGCPTVALYGPTDPQRWGPWPEGGLASPWAASGRVQRRGNVWLVQDPLPCMPCRLEGCLRHIGSHSLCLDEMPLARVIEAVEEALQGGAARQSPLLHCKAPPTAP